MNLRQVRTGVDHCLSNGRRIYDDAEALYGLKRYHTSIPLYVLAYEEFCKALYLGMRFVKGESVEENDFKKLTTSAGAHTRKILVDAQAFRQMLESDTDELIAARRKFAAQIGAHFTDLDKQKAIDLNKKFDKMFEKLHSLKMAMLYVGYENGDWLTPKRFNENKLGEVCEYLRLETIRVFYEVRANLFYHANQISLSSAGLTEDQVRKIKENADAMKRVELDAIYRTATFRQYLNTVLSIIDSI